MLHPVLTFLFGSTPATFMSAWTIEQSVERLRAATARSALHTLVRERAAGTVTAKRVSLQRAIPFVGNSFKPFFVGQFETVNGRTQLHGRFAMHWYAKGFMTVWFGGCALWTIFALVAVSTKPREVWFFPLAGIGMLAAGTALVQVGKWFARNDRAYLSKVITKALSTSDA